MSINNPVGNIPIHTPILERMNKKMGEVYLSLDDEEMKKLRDEINSVTDTNCSYEIKQIAEIYKDRVNGYVKWHIEGK